MKVKMLVAICLVATGLVAGGCGNDDDKQSSPAAAVGEYAAVKTFLTSRTSALNATVGDLAAQGQSYYDLIAEAGSCTAALKTNREDVATAVKQMQETWAEANPQYEKSEGVVAGVPELAEYDVILDAGSSAEDDPESAVPFDLTYANGKKLKQPGNFFFLTETALWGTEEAFACADVEPDLDGDGRVEFGEAMPDPDHIQAASKDMKKYTEELSASANGWRPNAEDVFTALVVMTPTMSEYFDAWKNSRFVAGEDATESSFVGSSRLNDIADILSGLVLVNENIESQIAETDPEQAEQITQELSGLHDYVAEIRDAEDGGENFTAEQADTYGTEAQERAERIAGQISQAASKLGIEIQE